MRNLNECLLMESQAINENIDKFPFLKDIRKKILFSNLDFIIKFTLCSYKFILESQELTLNYQKKIEYEFLPYELQKKLINKIKNKDISPNIILFNNIPKSNSNDYLNKNICSILTTFLDDSEKYIELNKFYNEYLGNTMLFNLFEYGNPEFIFELKNICMTPDSFEKAIRWELNKSQYQFSIDNFIAMVLIYIRIKAKVPIILIGETGCGKTSLISTLSLFLSDRYNLITFYINPVLSYYGIIEFFNDHEIFEEESEIFEEVHQKKIN